MKENLIDNKNTQNEKKDSNLNYKEKLCAFIFFNLLGYIIQLGSLTNLYRTVVNNEPGNFVFLYTLGNILSLIGTIIYVGVNT